MHALPEVKASTRFEAKVMDALLDAPQKGTFRWLHVVTPLAAAIIVFFAWNALFLPQQAIPADTSNGATGTLETASISQIDINALEARLLQSLEMEDDDFALIDYEEQDYGSIIDSVEEELLGSIVEADWFESFAAELDTEATTELDLDTVINSLSSEETETLNEMFTEYMENIT